MDEISNALRSLKMPGMAHYRATMQETRQHDSLSLKDGLQLLIQAELDNRTTSRNSRLVKKARFRYQTSISEVIYDSNRGVDKQKVLNLGTCDYVRKGVSVLITGVAGTGKSWLGTALGHQACMNGYKVAYYNVYRLFQEIALARISSTLHRFFAKLAQTDLLILDDFGMKVLDGQQLLDFMEIIEDRHGQKATIMISQLPVSDWYDVMKGNTTAADAILDRLVHTSVRFELKGASLRQKSNLKCTETERND
ncbi:MULTISPECIES: IS21-like element helper ATPase IstB [unclassified Bacteroides]|uniref:IS21-like element helper ATPase IstB n=1 Tax=unclassified Bacteroides TaxID=2646097 RepID=UPI004062BCC6